MLLIPSENEAGEPDKEPQEARQTTLLLQQVGEIRHQFAKIFKMIKEGLRQLYLLQYVHPCLKVYLPLYHL